MKAKVYKPFPPGTVRGPYRSNGWVQFMVQTRTGWVPFMGKAATDEADTEKRARHYAKTKAKK